MLKTLFGDLGPRAAAGDGYAPTEVAFAATAVLEEGVPAALPRESDPNVVDVFVAGSPAQSIREHFTTSRADLGSAPSMITLLDPSRLWAPAVVKALSDATGQPVEKLPLRERTTLRTLAVIERTAVPRRAAGPLKVYHADVRAAGLEHDEIVNALAERSQMTAVIVGALQPHALDALLRSLLMATQQPDWHCPWLVFLLPPNSGALRHRILCQAWPAPVRATALAEPLNGTSAVWNTVLSAWEACANAPTFSARQTNVLDESSVTKALFGLVRTEGVIACGVVDLGSGELLAHDSRRSLTVDLAARARRLSAARRVFSTAGAPAHDCEEMLITQGGRIEMLRAAGPAPQRLGLMLMLDRRLANVPLVRFKALQAEKQLH
ncbi:MAG: hypothetical protein HS128_10500 [Ideonella sp.]|nr:hypothetical protein [Ideonella sp.]MCC7457938.1 hypothetical protein [Nitrospira sp.]